LERWTAIEVLSIEASRAIRGTPTLLSAEDHINRGFVYAKLGASERSAAEFRLAVLEAPEDVGTWLSRGLAHAHLGNESGWASDFSKALSFPKESHSESWIRAGRVWAERGNDANAQIAYKHAAAGPGDPLKPFLKAGWWVRGVSKETAKQPFEASHFDPAEAHESSDRPRWSTKHADATNRLRLNEFASESSVFTDAVTFIEAKVPRAATLRVSTILYTEIWLNDRRILIHGSGQPTETVPLFLRAGRNVLHARSASERASASWLAIDFDDSLFYRGMSELDALLWKDALGDLSHSVKQVEAESNANIWTPYLRALLVNGKIAEYKHEYERMLKRFGHMAAADADIGVFASCYMPPDASAAYAAWTVTAEKWLAAAPRSAEHLIWAGNAHYRAAQFQKAEEFLRQAYERDSSYAVVWPLLASSLAQQGKLDEARGWLVRAQEYEPYFLSALLSNLPLRPGMNENEWPSFRIFKREAETLIEGSARTTHPLQTKFESRNRSILETADPLGREFALFELQNRHDISHRLAWARELATEGRWDDAEQEVDRRASIEPENSRLWIDWGHILVQLGRNENADRAYARAAAQYPSELSRFFEAGLWSVGPIKRASAFAQSIRQHTETTARVTSGDPPTERWNLVAPDRQGFVPLPPGQSHADESVFVLGHVFSPDSRSATLLVGGQGTPTFWLNGRRVVTEFNSGGEYFRSVDRVPLMLERGRNVLLVELQASSRLRFRLADNPGDQAADLASLGQIEEASTQFKKHFARGFDPEWDIWLHFGHLLRLQQDCAGFDLLVNQVMAHYGYAPQNPVLAYFMAVSLTSRPGELNADAIKALLNLASTDQQNNWNLPWTAWAAVRSGEVGQAARATKVFAQRPDDYPWIIPVWAMVEDAQGHSAEARYWLEKAHRWGNGLAERIGAESRLRVPMQWYDVARFGIAMSQARKAILGEEVAAIDDPIAKSLSQRGLKELKSLDHQARDFELAELLQPDNPRFRVGYARWLLGAGRFDLAEAYLARRAKQHHDPAGLWIDWGRSLAEQGRSREADAAYARAAVLAPDEPSRFLAAGWWVAGPYSELLSAHYPPEADPDPSRPLMGENGVLLDWKSLAVSALFECDLKPTSVRELASAYTLAHVYQLRERTSLLCMGIDDKARVWLNGQLIFDSDSGLNSFQGSLDWCVPVTLRAGRNTLLMKVSNTGGGHSIRVRFDDCGVETINLQAQFARWDDAVRTYERMERVGAALSSWQLTPIALLMAGRVDRSGYENIVARYSGFTATDARNDAIMFGLRENGKIDYNRLVDRARAALPKVIPPNEPWHTAGLMLALYRAGRYQETLDLIHKHCPEGGQTWEACIQAMAHHRLGEHDQATAWLSKADALYEQLRQSILGGKTLSLGENWGATAAAFAALRHEAHELVEGKPFDFSADLREMESKIGHFLDDRASPTWAFDVAVTMNPNTAGYELARAERLLELGRLNEGELALAKAAELKPDDPNVWQKRARIFEQRGDLDRAAGAYALMLDKLPQDLALYNNRGHTLDEILANEQVFKRLLELRPADPLLWYVRAARHIGRKEWSQALADYRQGGEPPVYTEHAYLYGASLIMVGDRAGYRDYVRKIAAAVSGVDDPWQNYIFSRTASLVDDNGVEVELVLRAGEKASAANLAWYTHSLAGALLRAGDPSRAVALLDDPRATEWQRHVTALLKSMAHAQLGHTEEARELLAISRKELPPQAAIHPGVPNSTLMTDWVELEVLGPEASAQILDPAFPADPFAR
jgi:tetratricopeptide (TPR) repeat protein